MIKEQNNMNPNWQNQLSLTDFSPVLHLGQDI